jgi:hypothetical protein
VVTSDNVKNYLEVGPASGTAFSTVTGIQFFSEHHLMDYSQDHIFDFIQVFFNQMRKTSKILWASYLSALVSQSEAILCHMSLIKCILKAHKSTGLAICVPILLVSGFLGICKILQFFKLVLNKLQKDINRLYYAGSPESTLSANQSAQCLPVAIQKVNFQVQYTNFMRSSHFFHSSGFSKSGNM